jgi:hypothetical protein
MSDSCKMTSTIPQHTEHKREPGNVPVPTKQMGTEDKNQASTPVGSHPEESDKGSEKQPYTVGYGRPPLHTRFRKGQSGNPKGRLKQSKNLLTIIKRVLDKEVTVREGGRQRRMTAFEALLHKQMAHAFEGNEKATRSLMTIARDCGYGADEAPGADTSSDASFKPFADLLDKIAAEKRNGK